MAPPVTRAAPGASIELVRAAPAGDPGPSTSVPRVDSGSRCRPPGPSVEKEWTAATAEAGKPRFEPRGISAEAHARVEARAEDEAGARWKDRESRFGNVFGHTVHLAIGAALRQPGLSGADAVARVSKATRGTVADDYPAYVEQVREYGRILVKLGLATAGRVRCGLLFTGDGGMRWV